MVLLKAIKKSPALLQTISLAPALLSYLKIKAGASLLKIFRARATPETISSLFFCIP